MKILCLHGAYSNGSNFKIQLLPFIEAVDRSATDVEFKWVNGGYSSIPPPGYEDYFGAPPLYRHVDYRGVSQVDDTLWKIRDMASAKTPEESMRRVINGQKPMSTDLLQAALDKLFDIIDGDPEIDGILGYSEGAMIASSLLLEEGRRFKDEGKPRRLKYAIFLGGWPPIRPNGDVAEFQMIDECEEKIDVPTLHIIGCNDPYINGALSLFAMCSPDKATLFDHGKGHTVPRDPRTIDELAMSVESLWNKDGICV